MSPYSFKLLLVLSKILDGRFMPCDASIKGSFFLAASEAQVCTYPRCAERARSTTEKRAPIKGHKDSEMVRFQTNGVVVPG